MKKKLNVGVCIGFKFFTVFEYYIFNNTLKTNYNKTI